MPRSYALPMTCRQHPRQTPGRRKRSIRRLQRWRATATCTPSASHVDIKGKLFPHPSAMAHKLCAQSPVQCSSISARMERQTSGDASAPLHSQLLVQRGETALRHANGTGRTMQLLSAGPEICASSPQGSSQTRAAVQAEAQKPEEGVSSECSHYTPIGLACSKEDARCEQVVMLRDLSSIQTVSPMADSIPTWHFTFIHAWCS